MYDDQRHSLYNLCGTLSVTEKILIYENLHMKVFLFVLVFAVFAAPQVVALYVRSEKLFKM